MAVTNYSLYKIQPMRHCSTEKRVPTSGKSPRFLLVSCLVYKEHESCHSILTSEKLNKLKNQQLFLSSLREERSQGKLLPPKLERQGGRYRESQLTRTEPYKQKFSWKPMPKQEILVCN